MQKIFSGVQPTGKLTLGNYLGAMQRFVKLQDEYDCTYSIVDLHALTVMPSPEDLYEGVLEQVALFVAAGIDFEKSTFFIQSHVHEHSELAWLLQCVSYFGEMSRMTQFKEKSQALTSSKNDQSVTTGLFTYPVLMAADILLYDADIVPVGEDQRQHVEITRDIAMRVNRLYNQDVFVIPKADIPEFGGKIMSLRDPEIKMSKSDENENAVLRILDPPEVIRAKLRRATTDSDSSIKYDPVNKPGVSNLLTIESLCRNIPISELEKKYSSSGYGALKQEVAEAVVAVLEPIQERYHTIRQDPSLPEKLAQGAEKARKTASKTLRRYKEAAGLILPRI